MKIEKWLIYAWVTTLLWGVWGAFSEMPTKAGFPATLGYIVWAISMIPCAIVALWRIKWKLDVSGKAIFYGMMVGLLGAVGQLLLFQALRMGRPILSSRLYPCRRSLLSPFRCGC